MPKSKDQDFKDAQIRKLPDAIGVYALCDLDEIPIYVGQSTDKIRARLRRHLTSARSDVIANRQLDVWEIAFIWAWPVKKQSDIKRLEGHLFNEFNQQNPLIYGKNLPKPSEGRIDVPDRVEIQIMESDLIASRKDPTLRFPRQVAQFNQLLDYMINVHYKHHLQASLDWHYNQMTRHYKAFFAKK